MRRSSNVSLTRELRVSHPTDIVPFVLIGGCEPIEEFSHGVEALLAFLLLGGDKRAQYRLIRHVGRGTMEASKERDCNRLVGRRNKVRNG